MLELTDAQVLNLNVPAGLIDGAASAGDSQTHTERH